MSFSALGLADDIVRAVTELGYTTPTPIQQQAIPAVLSGGDLLAGAQTGTGKTAGFTLPLLHLLSTKPATGKKIRALILTPTRELAAQVEESVRDYGKYLPLKSMMMFGGVSINPQIKQLKGQVDILVATPGRLLDHMSQKTVDLSAVEILILDEADRMLDMGFIRDIKKVLALLPAKRQNLLFSATFSDEIKTLADGLLDKPALIEVARRNATAEMITQKVYFVDRERKRELLTQLIKEKNWFQVLVFTRTKHGANRLAEQLSKDGINSLAIHGNKSQAARTRALAEFKSGTLQVLCATDIAARGIDIEELPHVVNFELPNVAEDYVHRIGRTGRAGSEGEAISLVCVDEHKLLNDIERLIKRDITRESVDGFAVDPSIKAEPILNGRNGAARNTNRDPRNPNSGRPPRGHNRTNNAPAAAASDAPRPPRSNPRASDDSRPASRFNPDARPASEGRFNNNPRGETPSSAAPRPAGEGRFNNNPRGEARTPSAARPTDGRSRSGRGDQPQGRAPQERSYADRGARSDTRSAAPRAPAAKPRGDQQPLSNENTPVAALFAPIKRSGGRHH
ncbi:MULTISPECIES: DEAD/DEAH box helicase [unclassified Iodobacter]|uniref:DEAD/DEAH box helicase n=1 Tax=unclassified Iodobacter TaxID=235634 RepID=UPI0025EE330B|nr:MULTISPECIES: DEAD/DEAH box helicase [unclassified Iodobacter]MDW5416034.1 DEAD/DEAH box helicase [Iodobacter sp. CM08]